MKSTPDPEGRVGGRLLHGDDPPVGAAVRGGPTRSTRKRLFGSCRACTAGLWSVPPAGSGVPHCRRRASAEAFSETLLRSILPSRRRNWNWRRSGVGVCPGQGGRLSEARCHLEIARAVDGAVFFPTDDAVGDTVPEASRRGSRVSRDRFQGLLMGGAMKVVILARRLGTRLREETEFKPKPMVEIGRPADPLAHHEVLFCPLRIPGVR